jgi:hypothetical protein
VIKLTLRDGSYDWRFDHVAGGSYTDSGSGQCHEKPDSTSPYTGANRAPASGA